MFKPGSQDFEDAVREAMLPFLAEKFGNPSSLYKLGRQAKVAVDRAKTSVARLLGVESEEIYFAPSAAIANDVALLGRARALAASQLQGRFTVAPAGHPTLTALMPALEQRGFAVKATGFAPGWLKALEAERAAGSFVHVDISAQAMGLDFHFASLPADTVCLDGAALFAPVDVSALLVRHGINLMPAVFGGGQERGLFPGTEPVAAIVGMGKAAELLQDWSRHCS